MVMLDTTEVPEWCMPSTSSCDGEVVGSTVVAGGRGAASENIAVASMAADETCVVHNSIGEMFSQFMREKRRNAQRRTTAWGLQPNHNLVRALTNLRMQGGSVDFRIEGYANGRRVAQPGQATADGQVASVQRQQANDQRERAAQKTLCTFSSGKR